MPCNRIKSREQQHADARVMGPESDNDYVTFRSLPTVCHKIANNVLFSRSTDTRDLQVYEDAYSWAAEYCLEYKMGEPVPYALRHARKEYWRQTTQSRNKYKRHDRSIPMSAFDKKIEPSAFERGTECPGEHVLEDLYATWDSNELFELLDSYWSFRRRGFDALGDFYAWVCGEPQTSIASRYGVGETAISLRLKKCRKEFSEFYQHDLKGESWSP